jgi:hypothetical protein
MVLRDPVTGEPIQLVADLTLPDLVVEQLLAVVDAEDFINRWRGDDDRHDG